MRDWTSSMTILLARKTGKEDSFIGYGIISRVDMPWELPKEEQEYCGSYGWKCAILFKTLKRCEEPLPLKKTFLKGDSRKGRFPHGFSLTVEQIDSLLEAAEEQN